MGLAASQARFLAITSRKMNCEFQSMQIAQQKLSVTRDLQKASEDYQNNLTATKLVWEDMDNNTYNLTYDLMMSPTAINQYDPYLVTDTQGRIVLTNDMFNAAVKSGVIDKNGTPMGKMFQGADDATNDGSRNAFLNALGAAGKADGSTISNIQVLGADGYTKSGVGGAIYDKSTANALTSTAFINYLTKTYKEADVEPPYIDANDKSKGRVNVNEKIYGLNLLDVLGLKTSDVTKGDYSLAQNSDLDKDSTGNGYNKDSNQLISITKDGRPLSESDLKNLTLGDILSGKYEMSYRGGGDFTKIVEKVLDGMAQKLGYNYGSSTDSKGLNVDEESKQALSMAFDLTYAQYSSSSSATSKSSGNTKDLINLAQSQNNIIKGDKDKSSVSLSNMLRSYLTNFALAIDGFDSGFTIDKTSTKKSKYATDDLNYYFLLKNDGAMTNQTMLVADFYNMLYNQLCMNGASSDATKREMISDSDYLAHGLKNGQLFVSSLNNDGYFYQGAYTLNGHMNEVPDEDAIARAELEYNVTKSKLNYKEETLELDMKNLDTEISALTTEYDTVKNLISKGVEKVFTMFSS